MAATAPIRPLVWEPPYAEGAAQEMAKRQKKKKKRERMELPQNLGEWGMAQGDMKTVINILLSNQCDISMGIEK